MSHRKQKLEIVLMSESQFSTPWHLKKLTSVQLDATQKTLIEFCLTFFLFLYVLQDNVD